MATAKCSTRIGRRLGRTEQTTRVRIAREDLRRLRDLTQQINQLERDITALVAEVAPQLVAEPGFGPLIAAKLVGEIAGAQRFATPAKLARASGVAPIPASPGNTQRQRLDQGGNRQINAALHRVVITRARCHPQTRDYIARRRAKGKTTAKRSAASSGRRGAECLGIGRGRGGGVGVRHGVGRAGVLPSTHR